MHGGVGRDDLGAENVKAVSQGCVNLERHLRNLKTFGVPPVVAINQFTSDTDAELRAVQETAQKYGAKAIVCSHWSNGSAGTEQLAHEVVDIIDRGDRESIGFQPLYPDAMPLWDKIQTVATQIYGAADIAADASVRRRLNNLQQTYGHFPVCMAKTQYSFSTDPNAKGAPSGHTLPIREVRLSAGAEFVVVICGNIMTMPGLPRMPAANHIGLNAEGEVEGLF